MKKSETDKEIEALKKALEKEKTANAKLKAKHEADKAKIKNLKRRKDPTPKLVKKKKQSPKLTEEQISKIVDILRATGFLKE